MKVALVHCPFGHRGFSENLKVVDEEFCLAPPIILAYVAAILEKAGHQVILVDANALKLTKEETFLVLKDFSPDMVGFRLDTYWFHRGVEWASYLKAALGVKVVVGGINVTLYPKESLSYSCFDYGIVGEANKALPQLLSALERGEAIHDIKGLVFKQAGGTILNPPSPELLSFDEYPFPARHLLPNHLYASFTSQLKNYTVMLTSTGCPFKCSFCAIAPLAYRERSAVNVVDEIEECCQRYGVREIDFFDATFFINKARSLKICDEILRRGIQVEWSCRSRVDVVDEEILRKAAQAGCRKIYYGIESVSSRVREGINKGIDSGQIERAIKMTRKYGIATLGFFMVGNPHDTRDDVLASISFAKKIGLDFIQVCKTIAKPGTALHEILIKKYGIDFWREYVLDEERFKRLPTPWTALSEKEVDELTSRFYRSFYFRPSYVVRRILKIKSINELARYIGVGIKWFFCAEKNNV
jgi:anaerobic magnesium-protoporphyrin IX monomethyl ester cyclase